MERETAQWFGEIKDRINDMGKRLNDYVLSVDQSSKKTINNIAISVTDLEIAQIEQAQQITNHDIAIIELQQKEA